MQLTRESNHGEGGDNDDVVVIAPDYPQPVDLRSGAVTGQRLPLWAEA